MNMTTCIESYKEELVQWRREFHMYPEIGFQEVRTSARVIELLEEMDVEIIKHFSETAVIAVIKGALPGPVVGLRSDMDALAMPDSKDVPYKSKVDGVCHSCGHDAHTAIGLGIAKYFSTHKEVLKGTLKIIFQPAEEGPAPGGSKLIVESGKVDDIEKILCLHVHPDYPLGTLIFRRKEMLASHDDFEIVVTGSGGHGAYPHQATDSLRTAIEIYQVLQNFMNREVDPVKSALLSINYFSTGTSRAANVMQKDVVFGGTLRTFDNELRGFALKRLGDIVKHICEMNGCSYKLETSPVSVALINDDKLIDLCEQAGSEIVGKENIVFSEFPEMGADNFAYFGLKAKGAYFYMGSTNPKDLGKYTFHQQNFDLDEDALCLGTKILVNAIRKLAEE